MRWKILQCILEVHFPIEFSPDVEALLHKLEHKMEVPRLQLCVGNDQQSYLQCSYLVY